MKKIILVVLTFFLSACGVHVPFTSNHFDSPETLGREKPKEEGRRHLGLYAAWGGTNEAVVTSDHTLFPPNPSTAGFTNENFLRLGAQASIIDALDLGIQADYYNSLYAKYQLIGDPRFRATSGNFSLSVIGKVGYGSFSSTSSGLFSTTTYSLEMKSYLAELGMILGYRFNEYFLTYLGGYVTDIYYTGTHQATLPAVGPQRSFYGDNTNTSTCFGLEFNVRYFTLKAEVAYAHLKVPNGPTGRAHIGVQAGFDVPAF